MVSLPYQQRSQRFPHRGDKISLQMDKLPLLGKTVLITGSARRVGRRAWILASDLGKPAEASKLISRANKLSPLYALVNSAAIFDWDRHLTNNLTAPFLLGQAFAKQLPEGTEGRIVNILDWRALRPGADHFPYTISKAALAAFTQSLAVALAPRISVNGLALGPCSRL